MNELVSMGVYVWVYAYAYLSANSLVVNAFYMALLMLCLLPLPFIVQIVDSTETKTQSF